MLHKMVTGEGVLGVNKVLITVINRTSTQGVVRMKGGFNVNGM